MLFEGAEAELVGEPHRGLPAMFAMMNNARLCVGIQGVSQGALALRLAETYAESREQGGRPIARHPDVARMLAEMRAITLAMRLLALAACTAEPGRLALLTPIVKAWSTDRGVEVASLGVQVHGGMGFVEETGAAQHYRDIRIAPIYEGTNGIQAADLVGRKLTGDGGVAMKALIAEARHAAAGERTLLHLADAVDAATEWMLSASAEDRQAGSYPFLDMVAVMAAGALMARQHAMAASKLASGEGDPTFMKAKVATTRFFLDHLVPEALGKAASATAGAAGLYTLTAEELAA
jgi:hypothetical protein